jgi:hypothetical protein
VVLSLLCLALAVLYPRHERAAFEGRVALAVADVDAMRAAARAYRTRAGAWPPDVPPGMIPDGLRSEAPSEGRPGQAGYLVDWNLWETVRRAPPVEAVPRDAPDPDSVTAGPATEAPPAPAASPFGHLPGITVHAEEEALLAALLERYGPSHSFIREGSWTLILEGPG